MNDVMYRKRARRIFGDLKKVSELSFAVELRPLLNPRWSPRGNQNG